MSKLHSLAAAAVLSVALAGCATDPAAFSDHVNNAVDNTHTAAVATVTIGTEIINAVLALAPAVMNLVGLYR